MSHLKPEQIVAYRDGELPDSTVAEHLAVCEVCRAKVTDARLRRALLQSPSKPPPSDHPAEEAMAAYFDQALSRRQAAKVERHVRECAQCTADLMALRKAVTQPGETPAPSLLVQRVKRQFRAQPERRSLGQVVIEGLADFALRAFHVPAPAADMAAPSPIEQAHFRLPPNRFAYGPPPSAAREADACFEAPPDRLYERPRPPRTTIRLDAGPAGITLTFTRHEEGARLTVLARERSSRAPAVGLGLTLVPIYGPPVTAETDRHGRARFILTARQSRLLIHAQHLWELILTCHA